MIQDRRSFPREVTEGMLIAGLGTVAIDAGLAAAPVDGPGPATDADLERLVDLLRESPPDKVIGRVVERLHAGLTLPRLTAAAALANARAFGGEDYIGFHTLMALRPALEMADRLPATEKPLPLLKVIHRNSVNLHTTGACSKAALEPVAAATSADPKGALRAAVRRGDRGEAERAFEQAAGGGFDSAWDAVLSEVEESAEVHRVVLAYRARDLVDLVGSAHARTMLRQSVRYCVRNEPWSKDRRCSGLRGELAGLLDRHRLGDSTKSAVRAEPRWIAELGRTLLQSEPKAAAEAVAMALAEGFDLDDVGSAISLVGTELVLRDLGRSAKDARPGKQPGSVHGDSIGVHASDSIHAWRGIARVAPRRHAMACLILAGYQAALDAVERDGALPTRSRRWTAAESDRVDPAKALGELPAAIRAGDQNRAMALTHAHLANGLDADPLVNRLLGFAISEDGALHAEKYFATAVSDHRRQRPEFRNDSLVALARVTASMHGNPAPGVAEARERLTGGRAGG
jgi:hypothetical protein